ncbi:MAG: sigma-54 dependent transcriptional regulator [Bacteroidota bacterium]
MSQNAFPAIIGQSPSMQRVFRIVEKVAATDANVLLLGENGTGKELIAQALHHQSRRNAQAFVSVDMGAISETLFESELFGHVKGAFTDARENRVGRFEMAQSGTLFLDEIGNLSLALQAKLLSALQTRQITRVGANASIPVDIRLISATNLPIHSKVEERLFRQDLLYRINTVEIHLPPLRERSEDIPLLAQHYLKRYAKQYEKAVKQISAGAMKRLRAYPWPGNVRELQHALERAIIMTENESLQSDDFALNGRSASLGNWELPTYKLDQVEKMVIEKVLSRHGHNLSQAAKELGLSRAALYRRLERYKLR